MLSDTHTHLYAEELKPDREGVIKRALESGVDRFFLPNIDLESIAMMKDLRDEYPDNCFMMMGLHPCSVDTDYVNTLKIIEKELSSDIYYAIGEMGLDYYWSKDHIKEQEEAFLIQGRWAHDLDLPLVIHSRDSFEPACVLIEKLASENKKVRGVFHCFGGSLEEANRAIDLGFMLGIGGVLTFKKSTLRDVLTHVDIEHLVLETDSPYLAPVPYRGKRNESSYIKLIAQELAYSKGLSLEEVARITSENASKLFRTNA